MGNHLGQHAVVIGGSMAGLMTARVLSEYFDHITILERNCIEEPPSLHKSIPHGNHLQALLLGGQRVLSSLYPDFIDKLGKLGAGRARMGKETAVYVPTGKAYSVTGTVREPRDLGFDVSCRSRGLLEYCVRQCTQALPNVRVADTSAVQRLLCDNGRVHGVHYTHQGGQTPWPLTWSSMRVDGDRGRLAGSQTWAFQPHRRPALGLTLPTPVPSTRYQSPMRNQNACRASSAQPPIFLMRRLWRKSRTTGGT